jgi:hypothetical protein
MQNKVVVHTADGTILKGTTADFFPNKETFHLQEDGSGETHNIAVASLKAVYFVKSFAGRPTYQEKSDVERTGCGRKIKISFNDGEIQFGYTQGYAPNRVGFFVFPADAESNNDRIYVITAATRKVEFL